MGLAHGVFGRADPPRPTTTEGIVREVHRVGRYPDDLLVIPERDGGAGAARRARPIFGGRPAPRLGEAPVDRGGCDDDGRDWKLPSWLEWLFEALGAGARVLTWIVVALVAAGLLYLLVRMRRTVVVPELRRAARTRRGAPRPVAEPDALLEAPLEGHAAYAAQGRYREAVHALFVESLGATGFTGSGRERGTTAREVVAAFAPRDRDGALRGLLTLTERCWFGSRPADEATYREALALHATLVRPEGAS